MDAFSDRIDWKPRSPNRQAAFRRMLIAAGSAPFLVLGNAKHCFANQATPTVGDVFVIDLENHNWFQPDGNVAAAPQNGYVSGGSVSPGIEQICGNPAAPYINSLVTPGNPNAAQVSYSSNYYEALANPNGTSSGIHPSEGNYVWQEAGNNDGVTNDNDPFGTGGNALTVQNYLNNHPSVSSQHLTGLMQSAGLSWKSYAEDSNLLTTTGQNANLGTSTGEVTSTAVATGSTTVPLSSFSGTSASYTNAYNGSRQYNYACKHVGPLYFLDTDGGNDPSTANVEANHYNPLQQLQSDLASNTVGQYNLITPDQYNDMHTGLAGGFMYNGVRYTGDSAMIAQGDNFLSIIIPEIEGSAAYKNNGMIEIWTDETEPDSTGTNQNDYSHTLTSIVISPLAKGNGYQSAIVHNHSSDLETMQEIFGLTNTPAGLLNEAGSPATNDLSDLFVPGAIPNSSENFSVYVYRGPGGTAGVPITGNWSANASWTNGIAPNTSTNKELDFLDTASAGYTATNDNPGSFSLNVMTLKNSTGNADVISSAPGSTITFAGLSPMITQSGSGPFSITSPIAIASNPLSINGAGTGAVTISGAISGVNFGLVLSGMNAITLTGSNTYTGATSVYSGTLVLDYTIQNNSKISGTSPLTVGSATVQLNGNVASPWTQTVTNLQLNGGAASVVIASGQTSLNLGAIAVSTGASINFVNNGSNTAITTAAVVELGNNFGTGILGAYAVYNGVTWATLASRSDNSVVGFTAFNSTTGSTGTIDPSRESLDITDSNSNFSGYMETLRYNTPAAITTSIGSSNIDFVGMYGGILMTANVGANNVLIQGNAIESSGDFYIHQYDAMGALTISAPFIGAGNPPYNLIKDGLGTLVLNYVGTENYGGNVYLNGGLLATRYGGDLQNTLIFNGGGLQPTNGLNVPNPVVLNEGGGVIDVPSQSASTFSGSISGDGGLRKNDWGTVTLSTSNTYTGGTFVNAGVLIFATPGALPVATDLAISGSATAVAANMSGGVKNTLIASSLTMTGTGKLDLNNNDMLIQNGDLAAITALVAHAYNSGAENGNGIFSSTAANDSSHLTMLGVIQNSTNGTPSGSTLYAEFDGFSAGAVSDVLIKYTYFGDANFDGKVDGSDYSLIDDGFLEGLTGWFNGDFNYDGTVNGSDYTLIDNAFNTQGAAMTSQAAEPGEEIAGQGVGATPVPEPTSIVVFAAVTLGTLARRRRLAQRSQPSHSSCLVGKWGQLLEINCKLRFCF